MALDYVFIEPASRAKSQAAELFSQEIIREIRETCAFCRSKLGAEAI